MKMKQIALENLTVTYDRHPAVHHVSGIFKQGELTAIAGPNGAGKSTLLKAIVGEIKSNEGRIHLNGLTAREIGYVPQAADINRKFPMSVADTVMMGAWASIGALRGATQDVAQAARDALAAVGLDGFGRRPVNTLSAGQFQRVLFARLLLQDTPVVFLDEPFNAVDARTTADLLRIICRWRDEGRTVIAVLHDFDQVRSYFPNTLLLAREVIAWGETAAAMTPQNLSRAKAMAESWMDNAVACDPQPELA
jgi:zinc/manganese transport system ATP-binding protein